MTILCIDFNITRNIQITSQIEDAFDDNAGVSVYSAISYNKLFSLLKDTHVDVFVVAIETKDKSGEAIIRNIRSVYSEYELCWLIYYGNYSDSMEGILDTHFIDLFSLPIDSHRFQRKLQLLSKYTISYQIKPPLVLKYKSEYYRFEQEEIICVETRDKNIFVVTDTREVKLGRIALKEIESKLNPGYFVKCNRSTIINTKKINKVKKMNGIYQVSFQNIDKKIDVSSKCNQILSLIKTF